MTASDVAAIVIGRNEGARLVACLTSLMDRAGHVIYVDSGSTDGSVAAAEAVGATVVALDMSRPFTAARARNAGAAALDAADPEGRFRFLQFIDGDCVLEPDWIETARAFLVETPAAAVACGRRRERFPDASVYNMLCDVEWNTPVGRAKACGGDSLMRRDAFAAVGGFDPSLIAGEEPELCVRLRAAGWSVWRLDAAMTRHDAAITRFDQWWRREVRGGWAFAEGAARHGRTPERHRVKQVFSIATWGIAIPTSMATALAAGVMPLPVVLAAGGGAYLAMAARVAVYQRYVRHDSWSRAALCGAFTMLAKAPQTVGMLRFLLSRLKDGDVRIIEYKT